MIFHDFFVKQAKLAQLKPGLQNPLKLDNIFTDSRLRQFWSTLNHAAELRKTEPAKKLYILVISAWQKGGACIA